MRSSDAASGAIGAAPSVPTRELSKPAQRGVAESRQSSARWRGPLCSSCWRRRRGEAHKRAAGQHSVPSGAPACDCVGAGSLHQVAGSGSGRLAFHLRRIRAGEGRCYVRPWKRRRRYQYGHARRGQTARVRARRQVSGSKRAANQQPAACSRRPGAFASCTEARSCAALAVQIADERLRDRRRPRAFRGKSGGRSVVGSAFECAQQQPARAVVCSLAGCLAGCDEQQGARDGALQRLVHRAPSSCRHRRGSIKSCITDIRRFVSVASAGYAGLAGT